MRAKLKVCAAANVQVLAAPILKEMSVTDGKTTIAVHEIVLKWADHEHNKECTCLLANPQGLVERLAVEQGMSWFQVSRQDNNKNDKMSKNDGEIAFNSQDVAQEVQYDPSMNMRYNLLFFRGMVNMGLINPLDQSNFKNTPVRPVLRKFKLLHLVTALNWLSLLCHSARCVPWSLNGREGWENEAIESISRLDELQNTYNTRYQSSNCSNHSCNRSNYHLKGWTLTLVHCKGYGTMLLQVEVDGVWCGGQSSSGWGVSIRGHHSDGRLKALYSLRTFRVYSVPINALIPSVWPYVWSPIHPCSCLHPIYKWFMKDVVNHSKRYFRRRCLGIVGKLGFQARNTYHHHMLFVLEGGVTEGSEVTDTMISPRFRDSQQDRELYDIVRKYNIHLRSP